MCRPFASPQYPRRLDCSANYERRRDLPQRAQPYPIGRRPMREAACDRAPRQRFYRGLVAERAAKSIVESRGGQPPRPWNLSAGASASERSINGGRPNRFGSPNPAGRVSEHVASGHIPSREMALTNVLPPDALGISASPRRQSGTAGAALGLREPRPVCRMTLCLQQTPNAT
jgi:hypothetical protein